MKSIAPFFKVLLLFYFLEIMLQYKDSQLIYGQVEFFKEQPSNSRFQSLTFYSGLSKTGLLLVRLF